jgi:hypothetical protein
MNKSSLHTPSLLIGSLSLAVVLLLTGAGRAVSQAIRVSIQNPIEVAPSPHPSDMVQILEGTPYIVPNGKILVITAVGSVSTVALTEAQLLIGGAIVVKVASQSGVGQMSSVIPVPVGLTASAGQVVTPEDLKSSLPHGRAWGYLVND